MATSRQITSHLLSTHQHINDVRDKLNIFVRLLLQRGDRHDESKLEEPELSGFAEVNDELPKLVYNSEEYKENLAKLEDTLRAHYGANRHHPQHWENGVNDMDLIDILEMLADWLSSTKRNKGGNLNFSLKDNAERFGIGDQLLAIMTNTIERYFQD